MKYDNLTEDEAEKLLKRIDNIQIEGHYVSPYSTDIYIYYGYCPKCWHLIDNIKSHDAHQYTKVCSCPECLRRVTLKLKKKGKQGR